MSGAGAPIIAPTGGGLTVAIIASQWHETVMNGLVNGALRAVEEAGATASVFRVPGAFEVPVACAAAAKAGFDAVVALGVVIRGGTPHFEYVCDAVTAGVLRVSLDYDVPVGFGVLTVDTEQQALDRAGLPDSREDKGAEAVQAALETVNVITAVRSEAIKNALGKRDRS